MKNGNYGRLLTALAITVCLASAASATIVPIHHYRMGEGTAVGEDAVGSLDLTAVGSSTDVAGATIGSTVAQDFVNGVNDGTGENTALNHLDAGTTPATGTNWGVEMWVNPDVLPDGSSQLEVGLVHIGGTGGGLAIELGHHPTFGDGNVAWTVHRTGGGLTHHNAATGVTPPTIGTWTHLAYVSDGGVGTLYVDGIASTAAAHAGAAGPGGPDMTIASMWNNNRRGFDGQLDEVHVFTFAPGQFNIADTFVAGVPEPSTFTLLGLGVALLIGCVRRRR